MMDLLADLNIFAGFPVCQERKLDIPMRKTGTSLGRPKIVHAAETQLMLHSRLVVIAPTQD